MSIKQEIFDLIARRRAVTFYELEQEIDGFFGDNCWGTPETNMFFWTRLSKEAGESLIELINEGAIKMTPSSRLVYQIDGFETFMDIAKEIKKYKSPRWFPVVFNPVTH
jgi:hypothetical protein